MSPHMEFVLALSKQLKYYLYANNDSVILLQQSQLSLQVHINPPHSFAK